MRGIETTPPTTLVTARATWPVASAVWLPLTVAGLGGRPDRGRRPPRVGCGVATAVLVLALAGCDASRPDFTQRSRQDCARGDRDACRMLEALSPPPTTGQPAPPHPAPPARRTRVQTDVEAIMKGIEQAKSAPKAGYREDIPLPDDAPVSGQPPAGTKAPE